MAQPTPVNIIAFPGAPNLPLFAAQEQGSFARHGLKVELETTTSSVSQFKRFGAGEFDLAFTAFDNVVAYREGQGAAKLDGIPDFRVIMGASQVELSLVVSPKIASVADLKGQSLALDAVGTGFAFVLYAMLETHGLAREDYEPVAVGATPERWQSVKAGAHAGTLTIEPFTSIAQAAGFKILARSTDGFPAYQGGIVAARGDWARGHGETVKAFIRAYREGLDWALDPAHRAAATALLQQRMPEIKPGVVEAVMTSLLSPRSGLTPGGEILRAGMQAVLALRSHYGPGAQLADVERYLDLSFFNAVTGG